MEQDILSYATSMECRELHMTVDEATGLKAIVAIHNTVLGPALGGCRCIEYPSSYAAMVDAIRLAQGMTYKAAISNLQLGGGKMVLLKPKHIHDRKSYFKAVGRFVDTLNGRYITAEDSGTSVADMDVVATETHHVTGITGGLYTVADPSVMTAVGVEHGIKAAVEYKLGKTSLQGLHVSIQGVGHVGYHLAKRLHAQGAKLSVYDIRRDAVQRCVTEFQATAIASLDDLLALECDVFAPSALGSVLNDDSIPLLNAPIVAGSANNQLAESRHGRLLIEKDILFAPDYVINAGGLIYVASEYHRIPELEAMQKISNIYHTLLEIFKRADKEGKPTNEIADTIARERLKHGMAPIRGNCEFENDSRI